MKWCILPILTVVGAQPVLADTPKPNSNEIVTCANNDWWDVGPEFVGHVIRVEFQDIHMGSVFSTAKVCFGTDGTKCVGPLNGDPHSHYEPFRFTRTANMGDLYLRTIDKADGAVWARRGGVCKAGDKAGPSVYLGNKSSDFVVHVRLIDEGVPK